MKDQTVWPAHPTPGVNRGYEAKTLRADGSLSAATGTCGALIYRGTALPACRGNAFMPEPCGNLVKRAVLTEKDGIVSAENATPGHDFLTSTDERFRPVVAADGPDGALYVVDMYRGIIQHAGFLTHYLIANIEARKLALPLDCGRIWRVVPEKAARPQAVKIPVGAKERAALLGHANGWVRDTAQRLLVEAGAPAAPPVVEILKSPAALTRLHALWTLDGQGALPPEALRAAFKDPDSRVRAAAVRMAGREFGPDLTAMTAEKDTLVRAHLAIKLSALSLPDADAALAKLLAAGTPSPLVNEAALTGLRGREAAFAALLAAQSGADKRRETFAALATLVSTANKAQPIEALLDLAAARTSGDPLQTTLLAGLSAPGSAKQPKLVWLDKEPAALAKLRGIKDGKLLAAVESRIAWPGKPGAPEPPKIIPLTPAQTALSNTGRTIYTALCAACHQPHGFGLDGLAPPLVDSEWLLGNPDIPARIILHGAAGPLKVGGRTWNLAMPPLPQLTDEQIAGVLTFLRREWDHNASPVETAAITELRGKFKDRTAAWTAAELKGGKK